MKRAFDTFYGSLPDEQIADILPQYSGNLDRLQAKYDAESKACAGHRLRDCTTASAVVAARQALLAWQWLAPASAPLIRADAERRFIIDDRLLIPTPDGAQIAAMTVRPRDAVGTKRVALLNFTIYANDAWGFSAHYGLTLMARFIAGMAAGVVWGLVAGYARRLAPPHLQGRAMAIVGVGQPIALSLGVPLGAWLGGLSDWRLVFWIMSGVALILLGWIRLGVPNFPGQAQHQRLPVGRVFTVRGVRPVLLVLFAWILAHNILYTYIAPFLRSTDASLQVDMILLVFGVASVVGIWGTGLLVDHRLRYVTLFSLAAFAGATALLAVSHGSPLMVLAGVTIWGLTFGGAPTLLQTALADCAGDHADVAQSILVTVFNLAVAGGGLTGGLVMDKIGASLLPWIVLPLILLALTTAWQAESHGFRVGRRVA
ncbi:MFS transporter [Sphingomonas sanguinis]|uniref:MFS transporter n=1 Tax=Sphingomonas sanguinis TaxID=33051 RepID=UPI0019D3C0B0|nr:MFS transporter [Sphingomonas sanguinis]